MMTWTGSLCALALLGFLSKSASAAERGAAAGVGGTHTGDVGCGPSEVVGEHDAIAEAPPGRRGPARGQHWRQGRLHRPGERVLVAEGRRQRFDAQTPSIAPGSQESVSELFPEDSRFQDPFRNATVPPGTDVADIEEEAHVLNYTTPGGKYCELWWRGGDGGTPLLAYLVDARGAHYLPELSQPKVEGREKFSTIEEARDRFMALAKRFYRE